MGCDGIWEVKSNQEMVDWIRDAGNISAQEILDKLLNLLVSKDSANQFGMDNMSAILIRRLKWFCMDLVESGKRRHFINYSNFHIIIASNGRPAQRTANLLIQGGIRALRQKWRWLHHNQGIRIVIE